MNAYKLPRGFSWTNRPKDTPLAKRSDQLLKEADALDREADRMEGTSWTGDMSPSQARRMEANEKRDYARLLKKENR